MTLKMTANYDEALAGSTPLQDPLVFVDGVFEKDCVEKRQNAE